MEGRRKERQKHEKLKVKTKKHTSLAAVSQPPVPLVTGAPPLIKPALVSLNRKGNDDFSETL